MFEYVTGATPRTHNNMIIQPVVDDVPLRELDQQFIDSQRAMLAIRVDSARLLRDEDARESNLRRTAVNVRGRHTAFDLRPGDMVSYDGKAYVLLEHTRSTPTAPVRSTIRLADDPSATGFEVLYASLRPMATHRPQHMLFTGRLHCTCCVLYLNPR